MAAYTSTQSGDFNAAATWGFTPGDASKYGPEKITNGDFLSATGWNLGAGWTISGGIATVAGAYSLAQTGVPLTAGRYYAITYTVSNYVSGTVFGKVAGVTGTLRSANGTYTEILGPALVNSNMEFWGSGSSSLSIDNVSVKEADALSWPSAAGDTFTVAAGHSVRINAVHTHELGASTVNGLLHHNHQATTEIRFNHNDLTISGTGEYRIGGPNNEVIDAAYTATVGWNTTSDYTKGLLINASTAKFTVLGDPAYVGSTIAAYLAADWTSGQTFTLTGDVTNKWRVGQKVLVHKHVVYSSYVTDCTEFTIASLTLNGGNTNITITEAAPGMTYRAGGICANLSRNAVIQKVGAVTTAGSSNTSRPYMRGGAGGYVNRINVSWCTCLGLAAVQHGTSQNTFTGMVLRNSSRLTYQSCDDTLTSCIAWSSQYMALNAGRATLSDCIVLGGITGINGSVAHSCSGLNVSGLTCAAAATAFSANINSKIQGSYIYANLYGFVNETVRLTGQLGFSQYGGALNNGSDFYTDKNYSANEANAVCDGVIFSSTNPTIYGRNSSSMTIPNEVRLINKDGIPGAAYRYSGYADLIKNTATVRAGSRSSVETVPLSNCSTTNTVQVLEWTEDNVPAAAQTRQLYVKGEGWGDFPANTELYLEAEYFNQASGVTTALAVSTAVLTDNTTWTALAVSFTPAQAGPVRYRAYLKRYAAGAKVYVDCALNRPGYVAKQAAWKDAQPVLDFDYTAWKRTSAQVGGVRRIG